MIEIQLLTTHSLMGQPLRFQEGRPPSPWIFCVAAALVEEPPQATRSPDDTVAPLATGWGAFKRVWGIPLERVHIISTLVCIGANPNLQRKMQCVAAPWKSQ